MTPVINKYIRENKLEMRLHKLDKIRPNAGKKKKRNFAKKVLTNDIDIKYIRKKFIKDRIDNTAPVNATV